MGRPTQTQIQMRANQAWGLFVGRFSGKRIKMLNLEACKPSSFYRKIVQTNRFSAVVTRSL